MQSSATFDTVLNQQIDGNFDTILGPHIGNLAYKLADLAADAPADTRAYQDDETLWTHLQRGRLYEHGKLVLERFNLFDFVPRAPGLYHSGPRAREAREEAFKHLDDRLGNAPAGIDAAAARDHHVVFAPMGKQSMLDGGVGCVRLKPILVGGKLKMLMSATSSDEAHRGIPVAIPEDRYLQIIDAIDTNGAVVADLHGRLASVPRELTALFQDLQRMPRLYLDIDDVRMVENSPQPGAPEVSVAVSFTSDRERRNGVYASYVTFRPGANGSFDRALDWLNDVYVEGGYQGKIITDFDQTRSWFDGTAISLSAVMGRRRQDMDQNVLELLHALGDVDALFDELEREDLVQKLGGRVRTKTFISYSHRDGAWLERLRDALRAHGDVDLTVWDDRDIRPGTRFQNSIVREINQSCVAILLISRDFLDSDFIQHAELPKILQDEERDGLTVLPLFVEDCNLSGAPYLRQLQGINAPDRPLDAMSPADLADTLARTVEAMRASGSRRRKPAVRR